MILIADSTFPKNWPITQIYYTIYLSGDVNPYLMMKTHSQTPEKLTVWTGILGYHIVIPFLIDSYHNGDTHLNLLQECVDSMITEILKKDDNILENESF